MRQQLVQSSLVYKNSLDEDVCILNHRVQTEKDAQSFDFPGTIIFSIHQPRYSIFKLFDTAMFMCKGRCVYLGPANETVPYFSKYGYLCETNDNPADYALDVLIDIARKPEILQTLTNVYQTTHAEYLAALSQRRNSQDGENLEYERRQYNVEAARSASAEFFYLSQRTIRNSVRNPALALAQTAVSVIIGLLIGLIFYHLTEMDDPGVSNRLGVIFFIIISQIFSNVTALEPFLKERVLFIHVRALSIYKKTDTYSIEFVFQEYASGYYRIWTYFFAKFVCDLLPMRVLPSILFTIITYFMTGLAQTSGQFFVFFLTIFMANMFGAATCFFISATISIFGRFFHSSCSIRFDYSSCGFDCRCSYLCRYDDVQWISH